MVDDDVPFLLPRELSRACTPIPLGRVFDNARRLLPPTIRPATGGRRLEVICHPAVVGLRAPEMSLRPRISS
jgi:hypothetical protein